MFTLNPENIKKYVADSNVIYQRGVKLYEYGGFCCTDADPKNGSFSYEVDGNYGDYITEVSIGDKLSYSCDCPYPGDGCKHTVAVMLDALDRVELWKNMQPDVPKPSTPLDQDDYLTAEEIKNQALEDRRKRAKNEHFIPIFGDMFKGEHILEKNNGHQYIVTLHDPVNSKGHCSCPDYLTNQLGTCKHLIHLSELLKKNKNFSKKVSKECFPFVDVYWDSVSGRPKCFSDQPATESEELQQLIRKYFNNEGLFTGKSLGDFTEFLKDLGKNKRVRVQEAVLDGINDFFIRKQLTEFSASEPPSLAAIKADLYPYQKEGILFALHKKAALIGDEMGLGKTLQAIALAILKKENYGFKKVLIVTLASLKDQWKREIHRFTDEHAVLVAGNYKERKKIYQEENSLFKITNYEAVLRDGNSIAAFKPDLIILDEAQRIKNFETKTATAIKSLPRKHALVLTGTPLENKLEDVYSIMQFLEPGMLSPLWKFAADHFMLSRKNKGKIMGYHNLGSLHQKLQEVVIRRRKQEVLAELPREVTNNYYIDLEKQQQEIHFGYWQCLLPILSKKFLTPMDIRQIQMLMLKMRQVCDSTYLIDRKTHISPKLKELDRILDELVIQNRHKVVIFSEWTSMTFLIGKHLSAANIPFVELSGKVPVHKRQSLIDEFTTNPDCMVFLSTDAGGTGLNLQAADCIINFELPWNPARLNQRIGRVSRIGQESNCINVVNLIAKFSIEEKILAGIQLKTDLFKGVFDGEGDIVEFSREKRTEMLNKLREMMGEEPEFVAKEAAMSEDIPEDTPHFLNPEVLAEKKKDIDYADEEPELDDFIPVSENNTVADSRTQTAETEPVGQSPEKMEEVLNQGMSFLSGLLEMATGQKIKPSRDDNRLIRLDKETGEVTMKFKLPGF